MMQVWAVIQFLIDHYGAICALGWGASEFLGVIGKGGFIPAGFQAMFKRGAQKEMSADEVAKLEQETSLKNK